MSSSSHTGVSRRSFMRILGAASATAASFPALAAVQQGAAAAAAQGSGRRGLGGADMGEMRQLSPTPSSSARTRTRLDRRSRRWQAIVEDSSSGRSLPLRRHDEDTHAFNEVMA